MFNIEFKLTQILECTYESESLLEAGIQRPKTPEELINLNRELERSRDTKQKLQERLNSTRDSREVNEIKAIIRKLDGKIHLILTELKRNDLMSNEIREHFRILLQKRNELEHQKKLLEEYQWTIGVYSPEVQKCREEIAKLTKEVNELESRRL